MPDPGVNEGSFIDHYTILPNPFLDAMLDDGKA